MAEPAPGPRAKINRAKKHAGDLLNEVNAFHASKPYVIVREADPEGGWRARIEPWPPPIPEAIPIVFGDLVHNLRSSLDILVCDLVRNHRPEDLGDWSGFPIVKHAKHLPAEIARKVKGAPNSVQKAIIGHKPYEAGNPGLWQVHRLDILDKHRLIIPTMVANQSVNVGPMMLQQMKKGADWLADVPDMELWIKPANPCDDEGGVVFSDKTASAEPDYDMQFTMNIAVHEPGLVECEPLVPFAAQLIQHIEATVASFDSFF